MVNPEPKKSIEVADLRNIVRHLYINFSGKIMLFLCNKYPETYIIFFNNFLLKHNKCVPLISGFPNCYLEVILSVTPKIVFSAADTTHNSTGCWKILIVLV